MKKLIKLGALSLALIAAVFMLSKTNAAEVGSVAFDITGVTNTACTYGTSRVNTMPYSASYSAFTADATLGYFECTDTQGISGRHMDLLADSTVTNGITIIPATDVSMAATVNYLLSGDCLTGINTTTQTSIGSTAGTIMQKDGGENYLCTIKTDSVTLYVQVPGSATVGTYVGSLSLTLPW